MALWWCVRWSGSDKEEGRGRRRRSCFKKSWTYDMSVPLQALCSTCRHVWQSSHLTSSCFGRQKLIWIPSVSTATRCVISQTSRWKLTPHHDIPKQNWPRRWSIQLAYGKLMFSQLTNWLWNYLMKRARSSMACSPLKKGTPYALTDVERCWNGNQPSASIPCDWS